VTVPEPAVPGATVTGSAVPGATVTGSAVPGSAVREPAPDDPERRYRELRSRVLRLHAAAVALDEPWTDPPDPPDGAGAPDPVDGTGASDPTDPTGISGLTGPTGLVGGPKGGGLGDTRAVPLVTDLDVDDPDVVAEVDERLLAAVGGLVGATDELIAFGERLPVLTDLPARALSVQIVRAAALAVLLGAVLVGLGIWRGILGVWWAPVPLAMLPVAARTALMPVAPAAGRHRRQRYAAGVAGAAGLLVAPVSAVRGSLEGLVLLVVFAVATSVLLDLRRGRK